VWSGLLAFNMQCPLQKLQFCGQNKKGSREEGGGRLWEHKVLKKLPLKQVQSAEVSQKRQAMRKERSGMEMLGTWCLADGKASWLGLKSVRNRQRSSKFYCSLGGRPPPPQLQMSATRQPRKTGSEMKL